VGVVPEEARTVDDAEPDLLPVAAFCILQRALVDKGNAVVLVLFLEFVFEGGGEGREEREREKSRSLSFSFLSFAPFAHPKPRALPSQKKKASKTLTHASLPFIERPCQCSVAPTWT